MDIQFWFEYLKLFQDISFSSDSLCDIWNWLKISPRPDRGRRARAGLLLLLLACCCCTCRRSLIHVLHLLGVYYPTAGSSRCSPQAGSRRPDPISRQSGRPATEACRAQFSPQRSSCETAETSFVGNRVPNSWGTNKPAVSVAGRNKNSDNETSYNRRRLGVIPGPVLASNFPVVGQDPGFKAESGGIFPWIFCKSIKLCICPRSSLPLIWKNVRYLKTQRDI